MSISDGGRVSKPRTSPLRKKFMIQLSPECPNAFPVVKVLRVALEIRTKDSPEAAKLTRERLSMTAMFGRWRKAGFINSMPS